MKEPTLKELNLDQPYFEANGKKYTISKNLSVERWRQFEDLQALVGFGRSYEEIFNIVKQAYEKLQPPKVADASVLLHNLLTGVKEKLEKRHHPALLICTLFVNHEDEDIRIYDEEIMNKKIQDWQEEGYSIDSFFQLAWNLVPGFIETYSEDLKNTLSNMETNKSEASKKKE